MSACVCESADRQNMETRERRHDNKQNKKNKMSI